MRDGNAAGRDFPGNFEDALMRIVSNERDVVVGVDGEGHPFVYRHRS